MSTLGFFSNFPAEMLEHILNEIASVSDLLSLALTSRAFCEFVIPWHLEYRWICCYWERLEIWSTLSTKPRLVAQIQNLEIWYASKPVVASKSLATFPESEEVAALPKTLSKVNRDKILIPPDGGSGSYTDFLLKLFKPLPWFQELQADTTIGRDDASDFLHLNSLSNYKPMLFLRTVYLSFTLQYYSSIPSKVVDLLIHSCLLLKDLGLSLTFRKTAIPFHQFLLQGNWPKLTRLTLEGDGDGFYSNSLPDLQKG
ncbi:hypothetical protein M422DRAFT_260206 [Sphaerobolus stellatus SS14]|uniref:F-box domain-containing protein n=1 Tax=Sphaerobolus stellatus (strain SS14) TaxID=990650 RepID=A0A0C9VIB2_SPHS4|nr:hypothetical protein M422DRAFT_260206 [Sphaerobolus stellatus SS14]